MNTPDVYHGILPLYKPAGMSSHDAVQEVRHFARQKGVGHTGTLDPLAEGLLLLCLGRATKISRFLTEVRKTYVAELQLGIRSETYDAEGVDPETVPGPVPPLSSQELETLFGSYLGLTAQRVPAFSAVQVDGERLYKKARRGETVELPVREIEISEISLLSRSESVLKVEVTCSKGTYIRSLAGDIGERIGCGAYLKSLVRTAIGSVNVDSALSLERVADLCGDGELQDHLLPMEMFLPARIVWVTDQFTRVVTQGRRLRTADVLRVEGEFEAGDHIVLKNRGGDILAVGTAEIDSRNFTSTNDRNLFTYMRVLN